MIIMAIIGIMIAGFFLWKTGRIFVQMVSEGSTDNAAVTGKTQEEILILSKIEFWTCQTGVYKNKENAVAAVTELGIKGWKASIINDENFIVSVGMMATKDEGAEINRKLEQSGISGWIKRWNILHFILR
jgi:cell division protein FtsN